MDISISPIIGLSVGIEYAFIEEEHNLIVDVFLISFMFTW